MSRRPSIRHASGSPRPARGLALAALASGPVLVLALLVTSPPRAHAATHPQPKGRRRCRHPRRPGLPQPTSGTRSGTKESPRGARPPTAGHPSNPGRDPPGPPTPPHPPPDTCPARSGQARSLPTAPPRAVVRLSGSRTMPTCPPTGTVVRLPGRAAPRRGRHPIHRRLGPTRVTDGRTVRSGTRRAALRRVQQCGVECGYGRSVHAGPAPLQGPGAGGNPRGPDDAPGPPDRHR